MEDEFDEFDELEVEAKVEAKPKLKIGYTQPKWVSMKVELLKKCRHKDALSKEDSRSYEELRQISQDEPEIDVFYTKEVNWRYEQEQKYINEFKVVATIGRGSYSKVKHVVREYMQDGEIKEQSYAMKVMHKPTLKREMCASYTNDGELVMSTALEHIFSEINVWAKANHPNIVKLYELIEVEDHDYLYLVIEFCDLGQISTWDSDEQLYKRNKAIVEFITENYLTGVEFEDDNDKIEKVAKVIFKQIISGLEYLHRNNIVHRDVKLDNVLISKHDKMAKLGDFSVSILTDGPDSRWMNGEGTVAFMAPEAHSVDEDGFLLMPTDIWSYGVTLYTYLSQKLPFYAQSDFEIQRIAQDEEVPKIEGFSEEVTDLLSKILVKDPKSRLTAKQIQDNEWFTTN